MTDPDRGQLGTEAQLARLDAHRQRRAGHGPAVSERSSTLGAARRPRRPHVARRSRIGVTASSVAAMFSLVGVMAILRPSSALPPETAGRPAPGLVTNPAPVTTAAGTPVPAPAAPPVALTAQPRIQVTTPTQAAPTARTHGSH
jgi:hypothetical protein